MNYFRDVKKKNTLPLLLIKIYMYQLFRALTYLHCHFVAHRDIKP